MCSLATCQDACIDGLTACLGGCVDALSDPRHCGGCGQACGFDEVCLNGLCTTSCPPGTADCDGACVVLEGDPANCGRCGRFCFPGQVCVNGTCGPECPPNTSTCGHVCADVSTHPSHCGACSSPCAPNQGCAGGACVCDGTWLECNSDPGDGCETDPAVDVEHCGGCGQACAANQVCEDGACACAESFGDCDLDPANGCEAGIPNGVCPCVPGEKRDCYLGPPETRGQGICRDGEETCQADGVNWGTCDGMQLPEVEDCNNGVNDDCLGGIDDGLDLDGDGFPSCVDCCDNPTQCGAPEVVLPGGFDFPGNMVDDDCDGLVDNTPPSDCSSGPFLNNTSGDELARAMDICWFTNGDPMAWGLISASIARSNGAGAVDQLQTAVLDDFGATVLPEANGTLAVISSGTARAIGDAGHQDPEANSYSSSSSGVSAPIDYLTQHGGMLEAAAGCPNGDPLVNDSVLLKLQMRAPPNAHGLSFSLRFYSAEYPEYLCDSFNDFFLAMSYSSHPDIPRIATSLSTSTTTRVGQQRVLHHLPVKQLWLLLQRPRQ